MRESHDAGDGGNTGDDYAALREPEDRNETEQVGKEPLQGPNFGGIICAAIGLFVVGMLGIMISILGVIEVKALYTGIAGAIIGMLAGWLVGSLFGVAVPEKHGRG
jgi:hypothetical protein